MKTFRNVVAVLGLLLLLYVGAYWLFAKEEMRVGYEIEGSNHSRLYGWNDWHKIFVPVVSLDYRMNVERPLRNRLTGHWQSEDFDDFVTLARDGQCSFQIGKFRHAGKAEMLQSDLYGMDFVWDGEPYAFHFWKPEEKGKTHADVSEEGWRADAFATTSIELTKAPD